MNISFVMLFYLCVNIIMQGNIAGNKGGCEFAQG